jgi:hypothetical protein
MDANDVLALGLGVTPPWKLVGQRLDTSTQPNQLARVATNNGAHVFPYGPMAAAALDGIPRHLDRPYLFPTARNRSDRTATFAEGSRNRNSILNALPPRCLFRQIATTVATATSFAAFAVDP